MSPIANREPRIQVVLKKSRALKIVWIGQNSPSKSCVIILDEDCCYATIYMFAII